jgi:hypothetical protein
MYDLQKLADFLGEKIDQIMMVMKPELYFETTTDGEEWEFYEEFHAQPELIHYLNLVEVRVERV